MSYHSHSSPRAAVIMGSRSDWDLMKPACDLLAELGIGCEARVLSAHRTPEALFDYVADAERRGVQVFIAAAGGAAALPGVVASKTLRPVLGVPVPGANLDGMDSLLSIVQMPAGIPVGTLAVGPAGAVNAALLAAQILALTDPTLGGKVAEYRRRRAEKILRETL